MSQELQQFAVLGVCLASAPTPPQRHETCVFSPSLENSARTFTFCRCSLLRTTIANILMPPLHVSPEKPSVSGAGGWLSALRYWKLTCFVLSVLLVLNPLTLVSEQFEKRFVGCSHSPYKLSVYCTDFMIFEAVSSQWYSHKFQGIGLLYEVGVSIRGSNIVWAHGPFHCWKHTHLSISRRGLKRHFLSDEKLVADQGYSDYNCSLE